MALGGGRSTQFTPRVALSDEIAFDVKEQFFPSKLSQQKSHTESLTVKEEEKEEEKPRELTEEEIERIRFVQATLKRRQCKGLMKKAKQRVLCMDEWVDSEKRYYEVLEKVRAVVIRSMYKNTESAHPLVTKPEVGIIFGNWEQITLMSESLLLYLENKKESGDWNCWTCLGGEPSMQRLPSAMAPITKDASVVEEEKKTVNSGEDDYFDDEDNEGGGTGNARAAEFERVATKTAQKAAAVMKKSATVLGSKTMMAFNHLQKNVEKSLHQQFGGKNEEDGENSSSNNGEEDEPEMVDQDEFVFVSVDGDELEQEKKKHEEKKLSAASNTLMNGFIKIFPFLRLYIEYCGQYHEAINQVNELSHTRAGFSHVLEGIKTECNEDIFSLLIRPVQRVPRYLLLLRELMTNTWNEHPDLPSLVIANTMMQKIADQVNQAIRLSQDLPKVISIMQQLNSHVPLVRPDRLYQFDGRCTEIVNGQSFTSRLYLFSDMLMSVNEDDMSVRWIFPLKHALARLALKNKPSSFHVVQHRRKQRDIPASPNLSERACRSMICTNAGEWEEKIMENVMQLYQKYHHATEESHDSVSTAQSDDSQSQRSHSVSSAAGRSSASSTARESTVFDALTLLLPPTSFCGAKNCRSWIVKAEMQQEKLLMFTRNVPAFHIQVVTRHAEWSVKRTLKEVEDLSPALLSFAPPSGLPSLPGYQRAAVENAENLESLAIALDGYLFALMTLPHLNTPKPLMVFLGGYFAAHAQG